MRLTVLFLGVFNTVVFVLAATLAVESAFARNDLTSWLGVYKHRFQNAFSDGEKYESENILEIVAVDEDKAYVRANLEFTNGHMCRFYGVAQLENARLVYRARADSGMGNRCVLSLERRDGQLVLHDADSRCGATTCGARGFYEGIVFSVSSRRPIRYLARLKASYQFERATSEASGH